MEVAAVVLIVYPIHDLKRLYKLLAIYTCIGSVIFLVIQLVCLLPLCLALYDFTPTTAGYYWVPHSSLMTALYVALLVYIPFRGMWTSKSIYYFPAAMLVYNLTILVGSALIFSNTSDGYCLLDAGFFIYFIGASPCIYLSFLYTPLHSPNYVSKPSMYERLYQSQ